MKTKFKIVFAYIFYSCEINKRYFSEKRNETRWYFRLHPRKIPMTILAIILTPFVFIMNGVNGIIEAWKGIYEVQAWSSYEIWSVKKPSNIQCYAKF